MAEIDIEGLLRSTAAATRYPDTPDALTPALSQGARESGVALRARNRGFGLAAAAVAFAAIALVVALAVEPSREAIARFFGVQGSKVEVVPAETIPTAVPSPTSVPGSRAALLVPMPQFATPTPPGAIAAATGFEAKLPAGQGEPSASYVLALGADRVAVLQYEAFDLWEARLQQEATFGKGVSPGGVFEETRVGGQPALWLSGGTHYLYYIDSRGVRIESTMRTVERSTLIWRTGYAFYRLETSLTREEAVRIAETLP